MFKKDFNKVGVISTDLFTSKVSTSLKTHLTILLEICEDAIFLPEGTLSFCNSFERPQHSNQEESSNNSKTQS